MSIIIKFGGSKGVVPLPPELKTLSVIVAKPWFQVDPGNKISLEGPAFDRAGNLFVTSHEDILKITPERRMSTIYSNKKTLVNSLAFHRDGRLFACCLTGEMLVMNPDGSDFHTLRPQYNGKPLRMNDLVFDSTGRIYVTDFTGNPLEPTGGVYRLSEDSSVVEQVCRNMAAPNGISLSPEGDVLWIGETTRNAIVRLALLNDGVTLNPLDGVNFPFYSTGCPGGPDSNKVDAAGNLYQCIIFQGRAVVLNRHGIPVANVITPGREKGKHLKTTNLAFKPGTKEAFIMASGEGGAWVYQFPGLEQGLTLYSHS